MILKIQRGQKIFITSDTHYGHTNICWGVSKYKDVEGSFQSLRLFNSLEEMNNTIVDNINNIVGEDDILISVGDWSFGGWENIRKFRNLIRCKNIYLIYGNHDEHIMNNKDNVQELFIQCSDQMILKYGKLKIIIFHTPIASWNGLEEGSIHLHGHMHWRGDNRFFARSMDVGVDGHPEFRPYDLEKEILPLLSNKPIKSRLQYDHHKK